MEPLTDNTRIADKLREMAAYYEMTDTPFKPAAYERVADALGAAAVDAATLYREGGRKALKTIPGVGDGIAGNIEGLLKKGTFPEYAAFKKRFPVDLIGLMAIENVGPKTVRTLYEKLKIKTVDDLERAAERGRIAGIPHFGKKTEDNMRKGIALLRASRGRQILGHVLPLAKRMEEELRAVPGVRHAVAAGSVRRRQETIGDLDILVTTSSPEAVMSVFTGFPEVAEVMEHGPTKTTVRLTNGMQADVRVVEDDAFGAALQYFTGSKDHNVEVRKLAIAKGLKLNEYGIWKGKKRIAAASEADVYRALGLPYIEPELRTATGELAAARAGALPDLVPYGSLRGDLQTQTDWTDGAAGIESMAREAMRLGLDYIAITDHTKTLAMTGGLDEKGLAKQGKAIDALNGTFEEERAAFRVLKGAEVNIMKDGSLDIADAALAKLDIVGAAVHSHFGLSREEQTRRVIAAMEDPHVDVIFHPTGRLIHAREPIDLDMERVLKAAKATGTAMEIDAFPDRSDLKDAHVRMAVELGVKLVIDTDAHHPSHFGYLDLGVAIARRGWATKKDILNIRPLSGLRRWLRTPKRKRK